MTDKTQYNRRLLSLFSICLLLVALMTLPGVLTRAESSKDEKKVTLKDAVVLEKPNRIRAKRGFTLKREGDDTVQVFKKDVLVGKIKCSVCPGGVCTAIVSGSSAACSGCGSSTGRDCTYDPF